ncbi:MAG: type I restriction endonuclease subunit R [Elainellaceae cyanobacterium]
MATIAVTDAILTYADAQTRLQIQRATDPNFFWEWQTELPKLRPEEIDELGHLSRRYLSYIEAGEVSEGTLNLIVVAPLLNVLGLCDPPYRVRGEAWTQVRLDVDGDDGMVMLTGRIDALTLQEHIWLVVIEGKRGGFNVLQAVPRALAYMLGNPDTEQPSFGLVTNGYDYLFVKATQTPERLYGLSENFTLLSGEQHNLKQVARILKRLVDVRMAG